MTIKRRIESGYYDSLHYEVETDADRLHAAQQQYKARMDYLVRMERLRAAKPPEDDMEAA